jgi:ribosomal protein L24
MSKSLNISVLVAARDEYIEQLKCILYPLINQGFLSIYNDAYKITNGKKTIYKFQELLKAIPTWNQTILQNESKRIKKKCGYIMDIVTAIFVSNVKILASIRLSGDSDNIKVKIPTSDLFIHSIYIECAHDIFYDPFLYYHRTKEIAVIQKNKETIKDIIRNSINETIRQMLPFDNILQEYLKSALDDNVSSDSDLDSSDSDSDSESENNLDTDKIINNIELNDPTDYPGIQGTKEYNFNKENDSDSGSDSDSDHGTNIFDNFS